MTAFPSTRPLWTFKVYWKDGTDSELFVYAEDYASAVLQLYAEMSPERQDKLDPEMPPVAINKEVKARSKRFGFL